MLLVVDALAEDPVAGPERDRRGGFSAGVAFGPVVGSVSGFPNDARRIGREDARVEPGFSVGGAGSAWVGITFNDWLAFGLGGYGGRITSHDQPTTFATGGLRVEGYPAFALGGVWRDLGVSVESGLGIAFTEAASGEKVIDAGLASRVAFGAHFDAVRAWKLSMGPFVAADLMWSPSITRPTAWIGWRTTFALEP